MLNIPKMRVHSYILTSKWYVNRTTYINYPRLEIDIRLYKNIVKKYRTPHQHQMDLSRQDDDVSYNSSDESQQNFRRPQYSPPEEITLQVTADSFREAVNYDAVDDTYDDASMVFSRYYNSSLFRKQYKELKEFYKNGDKKIENIQIAIQAEIQKKDKFYNHPLFDKHRKFMKYYCPRPNLYFLPTVLLLDKRVDRILDLRDSIVKAFNIRANVQIPNSRPQQILVTIHEQEYIASYIIRSIPLAKKYSHKIPELLDQDLSLNPLFEFYESNYKNIKLSQTCGIFLYWGYQRKLLNSDFLTPTTMKIIIILFYIITGHMPNIVPNFKKDKAKELQQLTKMCLVNKKLECELDPELFQHVNFSLRQKKSFYIQSQRKYSTMTQILPVPYPISKQDVTYYSNKCREHLRQRVSQEVHPIIRFFKIMEYLSNSIKRSQRVIFDFIDKKGVSAKSQIDFNIEIKHPVFGNNLCEKMTNDGSKLRILKQEINRVVTIFKRDKNEPLNAIAKIFQRS